MQESQDSSTSFPSHPSTAQHGVCSWGQSRKHAFCGCAEHGSLLQIPRDFDCILRFAQGRNRPCSRVWGSNRALSSAPHSVRNPELNKIPSRRVIGAGEVCSAWSLRFEDSGFYLTTFSEPATSRKWRMIMLDTFFPRAKVRARMKASPIERHLDEFARSPHDEGLGRDAIRRPTGNTIQSR